MNHITLDHDVQVAQEVLLEDVDISIQPMAQAVSSLMTLINPSSVGEFWKHPKWWQLANQHLFNGELELILVTSKNGEPIAALPVQSVNGLLKFPQHPHLTIIDSLWLQPLNPEAIDTLMDAILKNQKAWGWNSTNVPNNSPIAQCQQQQQWQWREVRQSAWFDTTGDLPVPGKLRRNLARHERHLEEDGDLSFSITTAKDGSAAALGMENFLQLEAAGWKGSSGTAIETDQTLKDFYLGLKELNTIDLLLEVHQLHQQDRCIAVQIGLRCGTTRYLLKIAYDESCAVHSPGSLLLWRALQDCVDTNIATLSLVSSPDWAVRWKPQTFPVWHVTRFAKDLQGALHLQGARLTNTLKNHLLTARNRKAP